MSDFDPFLLKPVETTLGKERYPVHIQSGRHHLISDEPVEAGGTDLGPEPVALLLSALGACASITMRMYADRKGWDLVTIKTWLNTEKVLPDDRRRKVEMLIHFSGSLEESQLKRLLEIAGRCPTHRMLEHGFEIRIALSEQDTPQG